MEREVKNAIIEETEEGEIHHYTSAGTLLPPDVLHSLYVNIFKLCG